MSLDNDFPIKPDRFVEISKSIQAQADKFITQSNSIDKPYFIHTLGGPGAGKSRLCGFLSEVLTVPFIAMDSLMEASEDYQAAKNEDRESAFKLYELPARYATYNMISELIEQSVPIILEHSGSRSDHVDMLGFVKQQGYKIVVISLQTDLDHARQYIQQRFDQGGRYTPLEYVEQRAQAISVLYPAYQAVADVFIEIDDLSDESLAALGQEIKEQLA